MVHASFKVQSSHDLERIIRNNNQNLPPWDMLLLHQIFDGQSGPQITQFLAPIFDSVINYSDVVENMVKQFQNNNVVTLERVVARAILAYAFFCKVPDDHLAKESTINFNSLYSSFGRSPENKFQKLSCLVSYLHTAFSPNFSINETNTLEYKKNVVTKFPSPTARMNEKLRKFSVIPNQSLSDANDVPQVDFANKRVGGGVLSNGCLQEEIKFITHPELLLTKLFPGAMLDNEAIIVTGALQFVTHSGYASNFQFDGAADPKSSSGVPVIAIDALDFSKRSTNDQFKKENIDREWQKAYAGFSGVDSRFDTIATGNWGGGSFKGDPLLKMQIQWLAASLAYKNLRYYPYKDQSLEYEVERFARDWQHKTIGELYEHLLQRHNPPRRQPTPVRGVINHQPKSQQSPVKRPGSPVRDDASKRKLQRLEQQEHKPVDSQMKIRPVMKREKKAYSRPGRVAVASGAALSCKKQSESKHGPCKNEHAASPATIFDLALFFAIGGGLYAIAQNLM